MFLCPLYNFITFGLRFLPTPTRILYVCQYQRKELIMSITTQRIRNLAKAQGRSLTYLCEKLGFKGRTYFTDIENNHRDIPMDKLSIIATLLNTTTDYLLGNTEQAAPKTKAARIPVYGNVAAGIPLEAITDIEDYEEIPADVAEAAEYIALRIHGDSMEPKMSEGDVVIVRVQSTVENGDIAIVMVNGGEATCKKFKKTEEGIILVPINPEYEPIFYRNKQIEELPVKILGKVIELRAKF